MRHGGVRLLWGSQVISEVGDWAARIAVAALVYQRTASPVLGAAAFVAGLLPWLGPGQLLATLGDRVGRRAVMVAADLLRALLFTVLVLPLPIPLVLGLVVAAGMASPPFEAARSAALVDITPTAGLPAAIRLAQVTMDASTLLGYLAGGLLLATIGPGWACLLNAGTFLLSAALVAKLPALRPHPDPDVPAARAMRQLVDAGRLMIADRVVLVAIVVATIPAAIATALEAQVLPWATESLPGLGWIPGAVLAGAATVSMTSTALVDPPERPRTSLRVATAVWVGASAVMGALFLVGDGAASAAALILSGVLYLPLVLANTVISPRLEHGRRAASFGLLMGALTLSQTAGSLLLGGLLRAVGTRVAFSSAALIAAAIGAFLFFLLRHRDSKILLPHMSNSTSAARQL